jgi:hypothetical protein
MKRGTLLLTTLFCASLARAQSLVPPDWDPALAGDMVMQRLARVTAPHVKGAHDAEFVCVGERAYIVEHDNDVTPGHGAGRDMYCVLTVVNLKTLAVEKTHLLAKAGQAFANVTLPDAQTFVPRIIQKDEHTLRCYFAVQPRDEQAQTWHRDFDLRGGTFSDSIFKAKLKTAAGTFDFQPQYFHADAAAQGFKRPAKNSGMYIFDSFKPFDGRVYVALNNFPGKQNALAVLHDDFETFEVIGHYNEPQDQNLSESAVNRLPDGTWMAILRNDGGNYHFTTSADGRQWSVAEEKPHVPNGLNSKPTFDRFGGIYYLGWQENTRIHGCNRSVFNVDISRDGVTWERKYRFETPHSFQYPTFHEHGGVVWLAVTQSDHLGSTDRIMFGKLETVGEFESQEGKERVDWPVPERPPAPPSPPGSSARLEPGALLFTDRKYTASEVPEKLQGKMFWRGSIERCDVEIERGGTLWALSPTGRPGAASRHSELLAAGFELTELPEFQLFPGEINRVSMYRKMVSQGERLRFKKFVIFVSVEAVKFRQIVDGPPHPWSENNGEKLHNGIVLPEVWPPRHMDPESSKPMPVPYLREPPKVIPVDVGRQLFVDDFLIEGSTLKRVFHQARKFEGNPVFKAETERELAPAAIGEAGESATVFTGQGGVFWDPAERHFKLFHVAGWRGPLSVAVSTDMVNWTRPDLGLPAGANHLLPAGIDWQGPDLKNGGSDNCVWLDLNAKDPAERYKFMTCWMHVPKEKRPPGSHHSLHVTDLKSWSPGVLTGYANDYCSFFYNPFRGVWSFSIKQNGPRGRCRWYSENKDFLAGADWSQSVYWCNADERDQPEPEGRYPGAGDTPQLYSLNAVAYESLMVGMHYIHRGPKNEVCHEGQFPKLIDLELGFSRDGFHWDRPDRSGFIVGAREEGAWDRAYLHSTAGMFVVLDDELVFPYMGTKGAAPDGTRGMYTGGAIGLAKLRRDGFASMDGPGELTTRPVKFKGGHLFVNLSGRLTVEVLDEGGKVLAVSEEVRGDSTKTRVMWAGKQDRADQADQSDRTDLSDLSGRSVKLRFKVAEGSLYSFWVTADKDGASNGYLGAGGPDFQGVIDTAAQ